jgi:hypothetical protein
MKTKSIILRFTLHALRFTLCLLFAGTAFAQAPTDSRKKIASNELVGKWTLAKIEVVKMQGDVELNRQSYALSDYSGKIYFEKMECQNTGQVIYSGRGDKALLSEPGKFHTRSKDAVVFQNSLIGFTFDFSWENKPDLFVLEKTGAVRQQSGQSERIRFFYQKEEL